MHQTIRCLIDEHGFGELADMQGFEAFIAADGVQVVFLAGNPERNLESIDVAIILPELQRHFAGGFDIAVAAPAFADALSEREQQYQTPNLLFYYQGKLIGSIARVREWSEYIRLISELVLSATEQQGSE